MKSYLFFPIGVFIPFETSDTIVLFHCGSAYLSNRVECSGQGDFEWECMFNDDYELERNILVVHGPDSLLSDEGNNDLRDRYMHDDLLFWKLRGKKLTITDDTFITKYKVGKINNKLLTLIRYP
ncbi:MAG: hypothetical protein HWE22_18245 [Flavobacteriales bacterium]|nr:hypothetical protein [Flavobacteriales bacterium]